MAKGNLFLGTARGSVGDITMYQSRGQQAARVRKRVIANPQSDGQILSRAIIGTVSRAYSAGRVIFDHSFEGRKQGQENQDRFLELNTNLLRQTYFEDIQASRAPLASKGRFCQKGASGPVPFSFIVSEGSLANTFMSIHGPLDVSQSHELIVQLPAAGGTDYANETVGDYMARCGVSDGDIFTIVSLGYEDLGNYSTGVSYPALFGFARLTIAPSDLTAPVNRFTWGAFFQVEAYGQEPSISSGFFTNPMNQNAEVGFGDFGLYDIGAVGIIRSRDDSGARSYCRLSCTYDLQGMGTEDYNWGIPSPALIDAWNGTAYEYNSELILEGGDIQAQLDKAGK